MSNRTNQNNQTNQASQTNQIAKQCKEVNYVSLELYEALEPLLYKRALKYQIEKEEVPGLGYVTLAQALSSWDPNCKKSFLGWVMLIAKDTYREHYLNSLSAVSFSRTALDKNLINQDVSLDSTDCEEGESNDKLMPTQNQEEYRQLEDILYELSSVQKKYVHLLMDGYQHKEIYVELNIDKSRGTRLFSDIKRKIKLSVK